MRPSILFLLLSLSCTSAFLGKTPRRRASSVPASSTASFPAQVKSRLVKSRSEALGVTQDIRSCLSKSVRRCAAAVAERPRKVEVLSADPDAPPMPLAAPPIADRAPPRETMDLQKDIADERLNLWFEQYKRTRELGTRARAEHTTDSQMVPSPTSVTPASPAIRTSPRAFTTMTSSPPMHEKAAPARSDKSAAPVRSMWQEQGLAGKAAADRKAKALDDFYASFGAHRLGGKR